MIKLRERYREHDNRVKETLKEAFEFKNKKAAVVINDVNYWTFGELIEHIPDEYYGEDPDIMMEYQLKKIQRHYNYYGTDDCYLAFLMPWYGTGVLASGFGIPIVKNYKQDPAVDISPIKNPESIKKLEPPDPDKDGLMPQVLKTLRYFKKSCDLPRGVTDCQGPLTTALSIIGYDNFSYWMYDYPNLIHELMDKVTEALIHWVKFQKKIAGIPMETEAYPLGVRIPEGFGGVWISDDDSVIIGTQHYREFVLPYNARILKAFGGGCIHYCGNSTQHIDNYATTEGLTVVNNLNLDNIEAAANMRKALQKKGITYMACDFIPTQQRMDSYYRDLIDAMGDQAGLIIVPYVAPAVELEKGRYTSSHRDQFELGKAVKKILDRELESKSYHFA
jgi:uroporphyrinogen-III decarboxylase